MTTSWCIILIHFDTFSPILTSKILFTFQYVLLNQKITFGRLNLSYINNNLWTILKPLYKNDWNFHRWKTKISSFSEVQTFCLKIRMAVLYGSDLVTPPHDNDRKHQWNGTIFFLWNSNKFSVRDKGISRFLKRKLILKTLDSTIVNIFCCWRAYRIAILTRKVQGIDENFRRQC